MKVWTQKQLENDGYTILSAYIIHCELKRLDNGGLMLPIQYYDSTWNLGFEKSQLGKQYIREDALADAEKCLNYITALMDTSGVDSLRELEGKWIRVAIKDIKSATKIFGHIKEDRWFDYESFFADAD